MITVGKNILFYVKGFSLLSLEKSIQILKPYSIKEINKTFINLPDVINENQPHNIIFHSREFTTENLYVWSRKCKNGYISTHGSVIIDNKVFCTDWDHRGLEKEYWKADNRTPIFTSAVIAPFSHYQDPYSFAGYYDFVFFVAAKLSRIKDALKDEDIQNITITYHPFGGHYEKEYLELLGFNFDNLIDSRLYKISAERIIFGNGGTWLPNLNEIISLKKNIESKINFSDTLPGNRIYICRKGRRKVENEDELIALLQKFNFIIIEDKERSVVEQIKLYRNASFILGPHGASFTNIIWCKPNTHLYELFSKSYTPDYFLYLSKVNNMQYSAYQDESQKTFANFKDALCQNIYVSITTLQASLEKIFGIQV